MQEFAKVLYHYGYISDISQDKVKIICPFHEDLKPSMIVDLVKENFYCFGCGATGGVKEFIMKVEKCSDIKSYVILNQIMKDKHIANIQIQVQPKLTSKEAIADAKLYFYSLPETDWYKQPKDTYMLKKRGFNPATLNKLDMRENFNHIYGVVAPMMDMGRFKGYVCRATVDKFNDYEVDRKYLYNTGFSRSNTLVGNYDKPWVIITEGFMDYAKLVEYGQDNSCAILGWKITDRQISKIQQYTDKVVSALDNTPTGREGTAYLREYFDVVRFQFPRHRKDIGDIKPWEWGPAWQRTLQNIKDYKRRK